MLNRETAGILSGEMAIKSAQNYQRFCSNFLATKANGFNRPLLFTNEEGIDWVKREGKAFPATIGADDARQIGVVVAYDPKKDKSRPIWGMGRFNHENSVAVPGYGHPVLLSGDDAFVNVPAQSQVYSYIAKNSNAVWKDKGDLWAFVSDTPGFNDYDDFAPGSTQVDPGPLREGAEEHRHRPQPRRHRDDGGRRRLPGAAEHRLADRERRRDRRAAMGARALERPNDVFQFVRIEDMAYDKRPGMQNVVYMADSGRGTAGTPQPGRSTNGRIWKMVLDRTDPTKVTSLSILSTATRARSRAPARSTSRTTSSRP